MFILGVLSFCLLAATPAFSLYSPSDGVIELTSSNFKSKVVADNSIWIVEFMAPWCGHCKQFVPEYVKAAKALQGIVKVGYVNADEQQELVQEYGVRGFPTVKIFGANKKSPIDYNGERAAKPLASAALAEVKKKVSEALGGGGGSSGGGGSDSSNDDEVITLTDSNFDKLVLQSEDDWMVEFYAPWCGHCKNLAPEWAKAAKELKGKVKFGALDATVHQSKAAEYQVKGYPTIKYFPAGKKSARDAVDYDGGRSASDIVTWASDKHAVNIPPPEIVEIYNSETFETACDNKPLCVVSVLPHILDCDANCRNNYLEMLKLAGEKYKSKSWGWGWCEGASQLDLEEALELGGFGYPAMAAVNFKKMKFSALKGSFSKEGIDEFLRGISYGKGHTAPVRGAKKPAIASYEKWDGKDGVLPAEEEIDLSDVDLDDVAADGKKDEL